MSQLTVANEVYVLVVARVHGMNFEQFNLEIIRIAVSNVTILCNSISRRSLEERPTGSLVSSPDVLNCSFHQIKSK